MDVETDAVASVPDRAAAEERLRYRVAEHREDAVREAVAAGLSFARIQKVTGLATTTIMRIMGKPARRPVNRIREEPSVHRFRERVAHPS